MKLTATHLSSILLLAVLCAVLMTQAAAQTTITDLSDQALRTGIASGGTVIITGDGTITLTNTITVTADTVLDATGHQVTLSGGNAVRLFSVATNAHFTVINLTIANGRSESGGAILNEGGTLSLQGVRIENSAAVRLLGVGPAEGGALLNSGGTVAAENCWFIGNWATNGGTNVSQAQGGAVANEAGQIDLRNCTFMSNTVLAAITDTNQLLSGRGAGGAVYSSGTLSVVLCSFCLNSVTGGPGVFCSSNPAAPQVLWRNGCDAVGGAICNRGTLELQRSTFASNSVAGGNGAQGSPGYGSYPGDRGGNGGAANGAALCSEAVGTVTLDACTFAGNIARGGTGGSGGGGSFGRLSDPISSGGAGGKGGDSIGGAIAAVGRCWSTNCTIAQNSATGGKGGRGGEGGTCMKYGASGGDGGAGGHAWASVWSPTNGAGCLLVNCTLAWNSASAGLGGAGGGGGISLYNPGPNGAPGPGGSAFGLASGTALVNTILGANLPLNCQNSVIDGGHNLSSDASAAFTGPSSRNNANPLLGPLADNGGPTMTISLRPYSPAIDNADATAAPLIDQRGFPRLGTGDIGAYEFWPPISIHISPSAGGGFRIQVSGPGGQSCRLLSSATFKAWGAVATNQIAADGTLAFQVEAADGVQQFFRAVIP